MIKLVQNLKLKRIIAILLLVCTVMSTFVTSNNDIYADSNDRRATMIQLAAGSSLSDLDAASNIDENSLRILSVYLSNFYNPFLTVLDGDFDNTSDEIVDNEEYLEQAIKALKTLGMDSEAAEFLAEYCLEESLNTCSLLYIRESDFDRLLGFYTNTSSYFGFVAYGDAVSSWTRYTSKDEYKKMAGTKTINGVSYIGVTYPVFLMAMSLSRWYAYTYTSSTDDEESIVSGYSVKNRPSLKDSNGNYYSRETILARINFYCMDDTGQPSIVYSNSEECLEAFLLACNSENMQYGVGTALFSVGEEEIDNDAVDNNVDLIKAWVGSWRMYVNWEGTLVTDTASYRTPVVPGCLNPHMFTSIEDSADNAASIPLVNFWGIDAAYNHYGSNSGLLKFYGGTGAIFNIDKWRMVLGSSETNVDGDWRFWNGGHKENVNDEAENVSYITTNTVDTVTFPSFLSIGLSTYCGFNKSTPGCEDEFKSDEDYYRCLYYNPHFSTPVLLDDIVYVNSFGGFNSSSTLSDYFETASVIDMSVGKSSTLKDALADQLDTAKNSFNSLKKVDVESQVLYVGSVFLQPLYATYVFAFANKDKTEFNEEEDIVNLKMNLGNFPSYSSNIDWSALESKNLQLKVLGMVYYLLHPTEGIGYVATLFKNKVGGVLLGWHEDVVGSSDSNATTGMTKYLGTSSYVTVPSLYDVEWIANILDMYNSIIVYLIILMSLILLCYVLSGSMTLQRGIIGLACFSLIAFIPPLAINATVNIVNTASDAIYSKKFDYWAICQMELFLQQMDEAGSARASGDMSSYAAFVISAQTSQSSGIGGDSETYYSGVKLKWMAPKKYNSTAQLANLLNSTVDTTTASYAWQLLLNSVSQVSSGETYLESDNALYLYRDYSDIYRYASIGYNVVSTFNYSGTLNTVPDSNTFNASYKPAVMYYKSKSENSITYAWSGASGSANSAGINYGYAGSIKNYVLANVEYNATENVYNDTSSISAVKKGFLFNTCGYSAIDGSKPRYYVDVSTSGTKNKNTYATSYLLTYCETVDQVSKSYERLKQVVNGDVSIDLSSISENIGLSSRFNFGLRYGSYGETISTVAYSYSYQFGIGDIIGLRTEDALTSKSMAKAAVKNLSDFYYGLYSESPFYFFNFNFRDQLTSASSSGLTGNWLASNIYDDVTINYVYDYEALSNADTFESTSSLNNIAKLFLNENQYYFFNLTDDAGNGYGELRDFMNMHDLFYYIMPCLRDGVELARLYDDTFGLYEDEDCSLIFDSVGTFSYNGQSYKSLTEFKDTWKEMTNEEKYKFWHSYNTYTILLCYTPWLDAMMDCDYADPETITVMGEKFIVEEPLSPYSYYTCDDNGTLTAGRYMIFSRSEMEYYGLTTADLTTVERKIIELQDNVYEAAIELMNYSTLSDETLIQAYAMLQTFEFNKIFSQDSVISESYVLYPQGYELKAFSYDAYLRMIISEASGESLMSGDTEGTTENESIYSRVMENTSLFFGIFLLLNDLLAVYLIPGLKLFFIIVIFFVSIAIIVASAIKMELNLLNVIWKSLLAPLISFVAISIGMSYLVSLFMSNGADGIVQTSPVIDVGDPTAVLIIQLIINVIVVVLYWKICKKSFHDLRTYMKAVFDNIGGAVAGAAGALVGAATAGRSLGFHGSNEQRVSNTAKQRGKDNSPTSGKNGLGGLLGAGLAGTAIGNLSAKTAGASEEATKGMNKWDAKAYDGASKRADKAEAKYDKASHDVEMAQNRLDDARKSGASQKKLKHMENSLKKKEERKIRAEQVKNSKAGYRDNIQAFGRGYARKKAIKEFFHGDASTRVESLVKDNSSTESSITQASSGTKKKKSKKGQRQQGSTKKKGNNGQSPKKSTKKNKVNKKQRQQKKKKKKN